MKEKNRSTRTGDDFGGVPPKLHVTILGEEKSAGPVRPINYFKAKKPSRTSAEVPIRGYTKLAYAANAFNFDFRGKTVLDIGSSTGGFTKYALDHGAIKVIAVEKGTNQMQAPLRYDPRVELHEKTDIFSVKIEADDGLGKRAPAGLAGAKLREDAAGKKCLAGPAPDIIVADVSFISLTKILAYAKSHLANSHTVFLVMLKPQFEARRDQLNNGVVKNEKIRREIIRNFEYWLKSNHFIIINKRDNLLKGKTGNLERFYYLKLAK